MSPAVRAAAVTAGPPRSLLSRRRVLWISLAVGVVAAVLFSALALAGPSGEQTAYTPLFGKPAPATEGQVLGGRTTVSLSQYAGKWVLVNFAASWCVPCQQEMPQLRTFAGAEKAAGDVQVLTIAYDESDLSNLQTFMTAQGSTWPSINAPGATITWGLRGVPESFLVDPEGTVVLHVTGGLEAAQLESFIGDFTTGTT
jgi:cytochrome c biogenesis protein CcmG, thiol:disulfide interchange protein DsbE